jgi:hypothetical protein
MVVQTGGFQQNLMELLEKYGSPFEILLFAIIIFGIVFVSKLLPKVAKFADTTLGRLILVGSTFLVVQKYGWAIGFVFALFAGLLIGAGHSKVAEGFNADIRVVPNEHKWFIERVLGENPTLIEEENVSTQAIQDNSNKTTGSVQNTSVSS